jgi:hypothetical protein
MNHIQLHLMYFISAVFSLSVKIVFGLSLVLKHCSESLKCMKIFICLKLYFLHMKYQPKLPQENCVTVGHDMSGGSVKIVLISFVLLLLTLFLHIYEVLDSVPCPEVGCPP